MNRFERSWLLFRSSLLVIVRNKELLIFPIFITIATAVILLFFLAPAVLVPTGHSYVSSEHWQALGEKYFNHSSGTRHGASFSPLAVGYLVFLYLVSMFVATFFNVAFYHEILAALNGESVSLGRGLQFAGSRWKSVLMWALFAGLIGLIIKAIERRSGLIGSIIARFIGVAWSIASVFAIPIIVCDETATNPVTVLKKSASTLKNAWGEGLIGYIGIGAVNTLVFIGSAVVLGIAAYLSSQLHNFLLLGVVIAAWVVSMIIWSYLMNVAGLVYKGALYLYAAQGVVAQPYEQEMLDSAWKYKKQ